MLSEVVFLKPVTLDMGSVLSGKRANDRCFYSDSIDFWFHEIKSIMLPLCSLAKQLSAAHNRS